MKKNLIALAVAGVIAVPATAMAEATVYGKLHASYGAVDFEDATGTTTVTADNIQLRSHSSRLGVKGSEDLGGGLSATYKLEWEVDPFGDGINYAADGDGGYDNLARRNQYLGLKGGFGEVRVGRHDTPLKMAQGKFDQFNDMDGDIANAYEGENRLNNVVAYLNNFGPVGIAAAAIAGEGDGTAAGDSFADAYSIAGTYSAGPLFLSAGMTSYDDTATPDLESVTRLVATYNWNDMDFGALYSMTSNNNSDNEQSGWGLSWGMGMGGGNKIKAQYLYNETDAGAELTNMSVGFDHAFSKSTTVYAAYNGQDAEDAGGATVLDGTFFGVGMIMKF